MTTLHTDYYERSELWGRGEGELPAATVERIRATLALVPPDISTILDVGCGDGAITNPLASRYDVTGIDVSAEALKYVQAKTFQGTLDTVPFEPRSFDLVTAFEVLEHLSVNDFESARKRMPELSRRYVMVTVPYREPPRTDFTKCPECSTTFNVFWHLRRFDDAKLAGLFPGMTMTRRELIGPKIAHWGRLQLYVRQNVLGVWKQSDTAVCPQCGNRSFPYRYGLRHYLTSALRRAGGLLAPFNTRPKWALAIYEHRTG